MDKRKTSGFKRSLAIRSKTKTEPMEAYDPVEESPFDLTMSEIMGLASNRIVRRGVDYARRGRVLMVREQKGRLEASVAGTADEVYLLTLEHDGEEILPSCTCPFDWEPFCKHAIAVLAARSSRLTEEEVLGTEARTELEEEEIERRRLRGRKGGYKVESVDGDRFFGWFKVTGPEGKSYDVQIRSYSEPLNFCRCADLSTSMLGTCKHIEAVLYAVRKRAPRKAARLARMKPAKAQVMVRWDGSPRVVLRLPERPSASMLELARKHFDAGLCFKGSLTRDFLSFLEDARAVRSVEVHQDAVAFAAKKAQDTTAELRRKEVGKEISRRRGRIRGVFADLYPYQVEGVAFLASAGRALLADDMGLGKTLQGIAAAEMLRFRKEVEKVLVICPASLKHQWASEIERFTRRRPLVVGGPPRIRLAQYRSDAPYIILNYELALRDNEAINAVGADLLLLDEAQRIRNWRTRTAACIKGIRTPFVFVLTGTPLQNRLDDLYSIMQVIDSRVLGPLWAFNERFIERYEGESRISGYKNLAELRRRLGPVMIRRTRGDVMTQLPPRIDQKYYVETTSRQKEYMEEGMVAAARLVQIAKKRPLSPDEMERLFMAMQKARMACNAAFLVDKETKGSPKLDELERLLEEVCIQDGRKAVVFSEWETFCRMAAKRAEKLGIGFVRLHGAVPTHKRGALIERFRQDPDTKIFFSTDAGGVGLNLQNADVVINLELPWNPAVLEQRIGRVHRHGQQGSVNVLFTIAEGSFEQNMEAVLAGKRALFESAVAGANADAPDRVEAPSGCLSLMQEALSEETFLLSEQPGEEPELVEPLVEEQQTIKVELIRVAEQGEPERGLEDRGVIKSKELEEDRDVTKSKELEEQTSSEQAADLTGKLGHRLLKIFVTGSGKLLAVVDSLDEITRSACEKTGALAVTPQSLELLEALGQDSPLHKARLVEDRTGSLDASLARKEEMLQVGRRKLDAAEHLFRAGLGSEAVGQVAGACSAVLSGLAANGGDTPRMEPTRLLYEVLVPSGKVGLEHAGLISKVDSLARTYADSVHSCPLALVESILADGRRVIEELV